MSQSIAAALLAYADDDVKKQLCEIPVIRDELHDAIEQDIKDRADVKKAQLYSILEEAHDATVAYYEKNEPADPKIKNDALYQTVRGVTHAC